MKLRNLLLLALGVGIGVRLATRLREDDPNVVKGPRRQEAFGSSRALRSVSARAQRLADQAATKSLDAIKRARGSLRDRITDYESDDALWN